MKTLPTSCHGLCIVHVFRTAILITLLTQRTFISRSLLIVIALFSLVGLRAQDLQKKKSVVTLIQQRAIYLNGGTRSTIEGASRTTLKVDLPANTKSWYYSFTTSPGQSGIANVNLVIQLSALLMEPSTVTQSIVQRVSVPEGSDAIDVYVLDQMNSDLFMRKVDLNGGNFNYFREGSIGNTKHGVIELDEIKTGTVYLGLKNPSLLNGINVSIEVAAIVEEVDDTTVQAVTFGNLGWKAFEHGDYDRCLELSQKALGLNNDLAYVHFNIGLVYLVKGLNDLATDEYTKAIVMTRKASPNQRTFEGAIQDLKTYMLLFVSQADAHDILDILNLELQGAR